MHCVYILYSVSIDKYYVGESVNPEERLSQHNTSFFNEASTKTAQDWKIILTMYVSNRSEARIVEKFIKSMKSKQFLYSLSANQEYLEKFKKLVLQKFSISILK